MGGGDDGGAGQDWRASGRRAGGRRKKKGWTEERGRMCQWVYITRGYVFVYRLP
jgi:hypothetical protein